jgi:coenzyme F420 hydrogenase subunit beta
MTPRGLDSIAEVVDAHLCCGCGACAYLEPDVLRMAEIPGVGRRPLPIAAVRTRPGSDGVTACPGRRLEHPAEALADAPFDGTWGPVLGVYECWATDAELRHRGSSGGVVSALAAHAVESGTAVGALQIRARRDAPLLNETVLNRTREEILASAGSRYAPASPCERLDLVEQADGPCVVIGKPCDIAATRTATRLRPLLDERVGLLIGIFCAGTPSTSATEQLITSLGLDPTGVTRVDYRGEGWPGEFRVETNDGRRAEMTYAEAWGGTLTKHRQWRCQICPDHTGEFADLSVGDPWYREIQPGEPGSSLVVVRTARGQQALDRALADGALAGGPLPVERLRESQSHLEATRGAMWARVLTMRLAGLRTPRYRNLPSARLWWRLSLSQKRSSVLGTLKRIAVKGLREPETRRPGYSLAKAGPEAAGPDESGQPPPNPL